MNSMSIKGALRYDIKASLRSMAVFVTVLILVWLLNYTLAVVFSGSGSYSSGFEMAVAIFMFVTGILSVRQDLRLFLQNGRGRGTVFAAQIFMALFSSAALALATGLLTALFQLITAWLTPQLHFVSLSSLFGAVSSINGIAGLPKTIASLFLQNLPAFLFGMLISLIYYRLSKLGRTLFSIITPGVLFVGLPILAGTNPRVFEIVMAVSRFLDEILPTPMAFLAAFALAFSCIFAIGSWLLLRRAQVS